jgi:MoxR-like ATPase
LDCNGLQLSAALGSADFYTYPLTNFMSRSLKLPSLVESALAALRSISPGNRPHGSQPAQKGASAAVQHFWDTRERDALLLAVAAGRPLLVRGEPGSGKSQLAFAVAGLLGSGEPLVEVISAQSEPTDLFYRFDHVARLADAQATGSAGIDKSNRKYIRPGVLWQAFQPAQAWRALPVVLIDEIDKVDSELPNALLEALGSRRFSVPLYIGASDQEMGTSVLTKDGLAIDCRRHDGMHVVQGDTFPLVVITTNQERELPAAFVRRCVVLSLDPPKGDGEFVQWMLDRSQVHRDLEVDEAERKRAAQQVLQDRKACETLGINKVGLAEFIDLLKALTVLTLGLGQQDRCEKQNQYLNELSRYLLVKGADQDQGRRPVSAS